MSFHLRTIFSKQYLFICEQYMVLPLISGNNSCPAMRAAHDYTVWMLTRLVTLHDAVFLCASDETSTCPLPRLSNVFISTFSLFEQSHCKVDRSQPAVGRNARPNRRPGCGHSGHNDLLFWVFSAVCVNLGCNQHEHDRLAARVIVAICVTVGLMASGECFYAGRIQRWQ
jgi:hypothetical protein